MYKKFFNLKERPFQLVPNPAYLFLSKSHEEALAHLSYAMGQGDGFVEITGEVGTGKTTLCRVFLDNLKEDTEAAYIFNPKLNSIQLLKAINDEFHIEAAGDNIKDLIDILNRFLMAKKEEGKKVILLIDEAQNLSKEVLEQLRLLSNLETNTSKLLQIILVGQPELGEMLDSYELRQLGQRITLSCHIMPLSYKETKDYIQHRIEIASQKPGVRFSGGALRAIYKYSRGTPRLINIGCDRAMLSAFVLNQRKISGKVAKGAINELMGRGEKREQVIWKRKLSILAASSLFIIILAVFLFSLSENGIRSVFNNIQNSAPDSEQLTKTQKNENREGNSYQENLSGNQPIEEEVAKTTLPTADVGYHLPEIEKDNINISGVKPSETAIPSLADETLESLLKSPHDGFSRTTALKIAFQMWHSDFEINPYINNIDDDFAFFRIMAKQNGFSIYRIENDFDLIKKLNLPAILKFYQPDELSSEYFTLVKIEKDYMIFRADADGCEVQVRPDDVKAYWSGVAYIPWRNHLALSGDIPAEANHDTVIALKMLLHDIGFNDVEISPFYDEKTMESVKTVQKRHGIAADGIVGPLTKIILYNEKRSLQIPHIKS